METLTNRFGIKVSRVGPAKDNAFHAHDIKVLFSLISDMDKEAVILAANNQDDSAKYAKKVEGETRTGILLGATGTPTFFVNGKMLVGAHPFETFRAILQQELAGISPAAAASSTM